MISSIGFDIGQRQDRKLLRSAKQGIRWKAKKAAFRETVGLLVQPVTIREQSMGRQPVFCRRIGTSTRDVGEERRLERITYVVHFEIFKPKLER
jgi:hypothetical protein